jgi:hypothetical protein
MNKNSGLRYRHLMIGIAMVLSILLLSYSASAAYNPPSFGNIGLVLNNPTIPPVFSDVPLILGGIPGVAPISCAPNVTYALSNRVANLNFNPAAANSTMVQPAGQTGSNGAFNIIRGSHGCVTVNITLAIANNPPSNITLCSNSTTRSNCRALNSTVTTILSGIPLDGAGLIWLYMNYSSPSQGFVTGNYQFNEVDDS